VSCNIWPLPRPRSEGGNSERKRSIWSIQSIHREKHRELTLKDRRRNKNQYISALEEN
jgi:hypothetical protein